MPPRKAASSTWHYVTGGNVDTYWRVENPCKAVGGKLCLIPAEDAGRLFTEPHDDGPFPWSIGDDDGFDHPELEGTAVFTRPDAYRAMHAMAMRDRGHRIVAEVDDNYLSPPSLNIFMRENKYGARNRAMHLEAMSVFDGVVCSTAWLRDTYHRAFKSEVGRVPELFVARNNVDLDDWPARDPGDGRLRVGWMGSAQHARDVKLAYPALAWAHEQGHEVVFIGHDVRDETGVTHPRALQACRAWRAVIDRHIPWIDPAEYHRTSLPFDIGLIPVERNEHTLGKSDVKALEYTMSGAAVVAQNMEVYSTEWTHGETAMLAGSPLEFLYWTQELCNSRQLREGLVGRAQQFVREERSMQTVGRDEWLSAL